MPYEVPEPAVQPEQAIPPRQHRRRFSRLGLGLAVSLAANYILTLILYEVYYILDEREVLSFEQAENGLLFWVVTYILPAALALLIFYLIARRVPSQMPEERRPLPFSSLFRAYFVAVTAMFLFNYLTNIFLTILDALRGASTVNPLDSITSLPLPLLALLTCVVAPVVEELTYRRILIPRLRPYGDRFAIIASALCFGLMHGNLNQFFYAFSLGAILGYVFLKTGCVGQTMLLHAFVNLFGGVIPIAADSFGDLGLFFYMLLVLCSVGLGLFFFSRRVRYEFYAPGGYSLRTGQTWRLFLLNFGMICFCLLCAAQAVLYMME